MGMSVVDLINCPRLEGPHDQDRVPKASEEGAPPPGDELTDEVGDSKDEGVIPTEADLESGRTLRRTLVRRNQWKRRTLRKISLRRNR